MTTFARMTPGLYAWPSSRVRLVYTYNFFSLSSRVQDTGVCRVTHAFSKTFKSNYRVIISTIFCLKKSIRNNTVSYTQHPVTTKIYHITHNYIPSLSSIKQSESISSFPRCLTSKHRDRVSEEIQRRFKRGSDPL